MNRTITLREGFDTLKLEDLGEGRFRDLEKYLSTGNFNKNMISYGYNSIRFINYVGIIAYKDIVIEILPKISISGNYERERETLIFMLSKCKKLNVNIGDTLKRGRANISLIDILGKVFIDSLLKEIERGFYLEYVREEEFRESLKGKLLLKEHIKRNRFNKSKVYCTYDEYTENNSFNGILKKALEYLERVITNGEIRRGIIRAKNLFVDIDSIYIEKVKLNRYKLNRKNERFRECFNIAKMILNGESSNNGRGDSLGFSILFEMNYLFEEYIGIALKEAVKDETIGVRTQDTSKYLLENIKTNRDEVMLRPDIVIYKEGKPKVIIDTKWKRSSYNQADIYQMYAYVTRFKECERCILLYLEEIEALEEILCLKGIDKTIEIRTIKLEVHNLVKKSLLKIISEDIYNLKISNKKFMKELEQNKD